MGEIQGQWNSQWRSDTPSEERRKMAGVRLASLWFLGHLQTDGYISLCHRHAPTGQGKQRGTPVTCKGVPSVISSNDDKPMESRIYPSCNQWNRKPDFAGSCLAADLRYDWGRCQVPGGCNLSRYNNKDAIKQTDEQKTERKTISLSYG